MDARYRSTSNPAPANATYTLVYQIHVEDGSTSEEVFDFLQTPEGGAMSSSQLESYGFDDSHVRSAIMLLAILHNEFGMCEGTQQLWTSHKLTQKLIHQLEDPLSVASGAMPAWCEGFTSLTPFLFSLDSRRKLLESTGFGVSHSIYWVQVSFTPRNLHPCSNHFIYNQFVCHSQIISAIHTSSHPVPC